MIKENDFAPKGSRVYDLRDQHPIDDYSLGILKEREPAFLEEPLRSQLEDMLRGLDRRMARAVIECLTTYFYHGTREFVGIWHIDRMLRTAYNKIRYYVERNHVLFPLDQYGSYYE